MHYFSGFCLHGEQSLFNAYLSNSQFEVAGFNIGAIRALAYTLNRIHQTPLLRIDKLTLLSPAFFQHQKEAFKQSQLKVFSGNQTTYKDQFFRQICFPQTYVTDNHALTSFITKGDIEDLRTMLYYKWQPFHLEQLIKAGIYIKVIIGTQDQFINTEAIKDFFFDYADIYELKYSGHLL